MDNSASQFARTTRIIARTLAISEQVLQASFRPATEADLDQVTAMRNLAYPTLNPTTDRLYLKWRYFDPASSPRDQTSELWVLNRGDELLCCCGVKRITLQQGDRTFATNLLTDALVQPVLKRSGLGAWMNLFFQQLSPVTLVMGANEVSEGMLNKLFHALSIRKFYLCRLRSEDALVRRGIPYWLVRLLAIIPDIYLRLTKKNWIKNQMAPRGVEFKAASIAVANLVSEPGSSRYGLLHVQRSPEFVKWRFIDNPNAKFRRLDIVRDGKIAGYVITAITSRGHGFQFAHIMDWDIDEWPESSQALAGAFRCIILECIGSRIQWVKLMCNDAMSAQAATLAGFELTHSDARCFLYSRGVELDGALDPDNWFLSLADTDGF